MMQNEPPTCPMCRRTIVASEHEEDSDDDSDVAGADVYVEGLSISLGISVLASQEIYRILKLSTRQVLTTRHQCHSSVPHQLYSSIYLTS
jgi:hypothetical protein